MKIAIVGAGLAGATIAYELTARMSPGQYKITIFDQRPHLAGNAHTRRDGKTQIMLHEYGPHIFHTDNTRVWNWFSQFATMMPHTQRTKGLWDGEVYSLPINLHTINQFFRSSFNPDQAKRFVEQSIQRDWPSRTTSGFPMTRPEPRNFAEAAVALVGPELYRAFFESYTRKQWGIAPEEVPASILKRLPMRFDYDDNAFFHKHQGIPKNGYTDAVANMLDHPEIEIVIDRKFTRADVGDFDFTFYSGPIDEWFGYKYGRLPYRTLDFKHLCVEGVYQGCTVLNNCNPDGWTRSTEHKLFTPWEKHDLTIVSREYSRQAEEGDIPYYPMRFEKDKAQLRQYEEWALGEAGIKFVGRLGTYQYLDMDVTIAQSLEVAKQFHLTQMRNSAL